MMKKKYVKPEIIIEELQKVLSETNEKLAAANAELEKANETLRLRERERTELFANLSHDLRASVSVIAGAAELLESELAPGTQEAENAALIRRRTAFLRTFIEDMFLLARLESKEDRQGDGLQDSRVQEVDVKLLLEEYFYSVLASGECDGRKLVLDIPEDFSARISVEPEMIVRVLDNLFTNAKKYSEEGAEIRLTVSVEDAAEESADDSAQFSSGRSMCFTDKVIITVSDTGIGIAPEDLPHIFERTFRAKRERPPEEGSSGLGLAIAKQIIENCGGRIEAESSPGEGTLFRILLPAVM